MKMTYPITLEAARAVAERHKETWEKAKARKEAALRDAVETKSHLPDNYWQEEHRAHCLYHTSLTLVEVLEE